MGLMIGVLIAVASGALLLIGQLQFVEQVKDVDRVGIVAKKVADQLHTVFNASYQYVSGIGVSPSNWSITELKSSRLLPSTFDDRTALGQTYSIHYVRNSCNNLVMDLVVKIEDTGDSENIRMWERAGVKTHQVGKRYVYSIVTQKLQEFTYPRDMKNPCGDNLPSYEIGYILDGTVYVDGVVRTDLNIPSSLLTNDGVFIYGYAPNQWGYLVVTFRFLRGDEPLNEYYDFSGSNTFLQVYMSELLAWRQADMIWAKNCPSGYIDLSAESVGFVATANAGWLNFCVPAFKSDITKEKVSRIKTEYWKFYGVDAGLVESDSCVVWNEWMRFATDLSSFIGGWSRSLCTNYSDSSLDSEFSSIVNRWLYEVHREAWGGRSVTWLKSNEPLFTYPDPNFFIFRSITLKDPLQPRYYQLVAYFYRFYTGQGCSPGELGLNGTSDLTGLSYPPQAQIWTTGWKWARANNPVDFWSANPSLASSTGGCDPTGTTALADEYENFGSARRFKGHQIVLRVLDNETDASQYSVPIDYEICTVRRVGTSYTRQCTPRSYTWVIPTPIY